jgi:phosphoenolpyruvate carboxykinase (ATP)
MQQDNPTQDCNEYGLSQYGLSNLNDVYWNIPTARLYEKILTRREGRLSHLGPLVVRTGHHTGRSANDKFIVREPSTDEKVWWGPINTPMSEETFDRLYRRVVLHLQMNDLFVQDCFAGADPKHRLPVRIITQYGWHSLFARNMFIQPELDELRNHVPAFTVIDAPHFHAAPSLDGTHSETFIIINFKKRLVLIGGTSYAGEIKKSIFSVMNFLLPDKGVLPMHCSANIGPDGHSALFFGLSGTGKTTLSADASRVLIGDDEHGWSDDGIFNIEGGCYAKLIGLSPSGEPEIYSTTKRFGTILENVALDARTRRIDLDDDTFTENTRASYHISAIPNASQTGLGGHPKTIIFLSADAFGVLPPISRLSPEQAMYHFLSGYTAKIAGTERGVNAPSPVFSACYGAPFMPRHPMRYAELLGQKLRQHQAQVWLINTGWSGGPYGTGKRIALGHTRAMVNAALDGSLNAIPTSREPFFGLMVPASCPGVPDEILSPRKTWPSGSDYDSQAQKLAALFRKNFEKFSDQTSPEIQAAAPPE